MEERCDQVADCRDKSDENNCKLTWMEPSYNKLIPPITKTRKTNPVTISIVLMKIVRMEETDHKIDMQVEIILRWTENERVKYHNLKRNTAQNALPEDDFKELWLPQVIYTNTDQKETTSLGQWSTSVTITREETPVRSGLEVLDEIEIFSGNNNTLSLHQTYTHQFQCKYHLHRYPFDTQVNAG
jgi:hypothetical protein